MSRRTCWHRQIRALLLVGDVADILFPLGAAQVADDLRADPIYPHARGIPKTQPTVEADGSQRLAGGAEADVQQVRPMSLQGNTDRLARCNVPQPQRPVLAAGGEGLAIRAERET